MSQYRRPILLTFGASRLTNKGQSRTHVWMDVEHDACGREGQTRSFATFTFDHAMKVGSGRSVRIDTNQILWGAHWQSGLETPPGYVSFMDQRNLYGRLCTRFTETDKPFKDPSQAAAAAM